MITRFSLALIFGFILTRGIFVSADEKQLVPTPPLGWNSYDAFGDSVTEDEVMSNAMYLKEHLLSHGWNYIVVDYRWYDQGAHSGDLKDRAGQTLCADEFGRLIPAPNRFPSAANGKGFKPLAEKIHSMGMKFGIHVMRGIPQQDLKANTPIEGSAFHAADCANTASTCKWNPDMFGVNGASDAGQAWYDSILRQYASWDVDYIKVDDLSSPYSADEIEAIHRAIDKCGRSIVLSLSPGDTPVAQAEHVQANANLWRISNDFWDHWRQLDHQFDLIARWQGEPQPNHWPDADMIPLGHVGIRCHGAHGDHWTHLSNDEQLTLMSLWSIMPSPLMLGMNLPDNDDWTNSLLSNDEVLAINQDPLAAPSHLLTDVGPYEIWSKRLRDGQFAVGFFNRSIAAKEMTLNLASMGLLKPQSVYDVWHHQDLGTKDADISLWIPPHGAALMRLKSAK